MRLKPVLLAVMVGLVWSAADIGAATAAGDIGSRVDRTLRSLDEPKPKPPPKNPCKGLTPAQQKHSAACQAYLS